MLKVYIGEKLIVEGGEKGLDVGFVEAGVFENDDCAGDRAIGEVVEVDSRDVIPAALGEKAFGGRRAEGAFPGKFHVSKVKIQFVNASEAGTMAIITRQPLPR